jgi:hypothetical protein
VPRAVPHTGDSLRVGNSLSHRGQSLTPGSASTPGQPLAPRIVPRTGDSLYPEGSLHTGNSLHTEGSPPLPGTVPHAGGWDGLSAGTAPLAGDNPSCGKPSENLDQITHSRRRKTWRIGSCRRKKTVDSCSPDRTGCRRQPPRRGQPLYRGQPPHRGSPSRRGQPLVQGNPPHRGRPLRRDSPSRRRQSLTRETKRKLIADHIQPPPKDAPHREPPQEEDRGQL